MNDDHGGPTPWQKQIHDLKTYLLIVTMGLELLDDARGDEARFAEVLATVRRDGIEPLKRALGDLADPGNF